MDSTPLEADQLHGRPHDVFVELISDILNATPGLRYALETVDPHHPDAEHLPYATFVIETHAAYELGVSIQLFDADFTLRVNDQSFSLPLYDPRHVERWIAARCRDVEHLVQGDLKIETERILGQYLSSELFAGTNNRWIEIADRDDGWGWLGFLGWLLPFGLSPFRTEEVEYRDWFEVEAIEAPEHDDIARP